MWQKAGALLVFALTTASFAQSPSPGEAAVAIAALVALIELERRDRLRLRKAINRLMKK
jgi:hypothetical protein